MARPKRTKKDSTPSDLSWSADTELVGLVFELTPRAADYLYPQYTTNDFSNQQFDQDAFLEWVEECVLIHRHRLESVKVAAGKKGSVTGFTGAIELGLASAASSQPEFEQLFYALGQFAPYCATGHKTTFGLGQYKGGMANPRNADCTIAAEFVSTTDCRVARAVFRSTQACGWHSCNGDC